MVEIYHSSKFYQFFRSFVFLSHVAYGVALDQTVPIINEKCEILGRISVRIEPIAGKYIFFSFYLSMNSQ